MKLIHTDSNKDTHEVSIGYCFDHGPMNMEVVWMPEPHKPASSGFVTCMNHTLNVSERECYTQCYDMKWIEREDQGWVHPEVELRNVLGMYEDMYDDDISGLDLVSVIDMIDQVDLDHLQHYPQFTTPMLEWLAKNNVPSPIKS